MPRGAGAGGAARTGLCAAGYQRIARPQPVKQLRKARQQPGSRNVCKLLTFCPNYNPRFSQMNDQKAWRGPVPARAASASSGSYLWVGRTPSAGSPDSSGRPACGCDLSIPGLHYFDRTGRRSHHRGVQRGRAQASPLATLRSFWIHFDLFMKATV
jgi:hypothetical protein